MSDQTIIMRSSVHHDGVCILMVSHFDGLEASDSLGTAHTLLTIDAHDCIPSMNQSLNLHNEYVDHTTPEQRRRLSRPFIRGALLLDERERAIGFKP